MNYLKIFTVFFNAIAPNGTRFTSSTTICATSKEDAAARVMQEYSYATAVTSVMGGR